MDDAALNEHIRKFQSQIGDDVSHIYDHEALFKLAVADITALRADVTRLTASLAAAEGEAGRLREALTDIAQPFSCGCTPYCRCFEGETGREIVLEIQERAETALSDPAS